MIEEEIPSSQKAVSLGYLTELYVQDKTDRKQRQRLKQNNCASFPDLLFRSGTHQNIPQIVVSSIDNILSSEFHQLQREHLLKFAASKLRKDIVSAIDNASSLLWPPKPEDLLKKRGKHRLR